MNLNRRSFLRLGAAGTAGFAILSSARRLYADDFGGMKKRVGLIGCGWYGKSDLWRLLQVAPVEVVALCDVDRNLLAEAAGMAEARQASKKKPRTHGDYREMLKEKDLDLVLVGTPDHWHTLQAIAAMEAGADVYLQKPISVDVAEGEAILAAARRLSRVVQVGTQRKSTPHLVDAKKNIVDAGLLGKVSHVEMCCYYHMRANGKPEIQPVPDFLDYEMWTGPAPLRPYDGIPHRRWWRTFQEYGNGILGDMCIHMYDTARWLLGAGWPRRVSSTGGIFVQKEGKSNIPDTQTAIFEHDDLTMVWQHRSWGTPPDPDYPWALTLFGEKGTLKASVQRYEFTPQAKGAEKIRKDCVYEREQFPADLTEKDIELHAAPATRAHMKDFLSAVASRGRPVADIEQGHISTASCILANVALNVGRPLHYDPATRAVTGDAEATALLKRPYRAPWTHPG